MSPFLTLSPHCQFLRWVTYNGGVCINACWVLLGSWLISKFQHLLNVLVEPCIKDSDKECVKDSDKECAKDSDLEEETDESEDNESEQEDKVKEEKEVKVEESTSRTKLRTLRNRLRYKKNT